MAVSEKVATHAVVNGPQALECLRERFGVDGHRLMEAMASSLAIARGRQSDLDIRQTRGAARYNAVGVGAREVFLSAGYSLLAALPRILRRDSDPVEVALYFGDENTGLPERTPTNAYAKGDSMDDLVATNQGQLFPDLVPAFRPREKSRPLNDADAPVWVLLVRPQGGRLRAEISLPCGDNGLGFICEWSERLLLPEVEIQLGEETESWPEEPVGFAPAIDVPVKPR